MKEGYTPKQNDTIKSKGGNLNKDLSKALNKEVKKRFPALDLTPDDMCHIAVMTLSTLAGFLRKKTTFNGARLLKYARDSVKDLVESN